MQKLGDVALLRPAPQDLISPLSGLVHCNTHRQVASTSFTSFELAVAQPELNERYRCPLNGADPYVDVRGRGVRIADHVFSCKYQPECNMNTGTTHAWVY
jgi:hypothetical protein